MEQGKATVPHRNVGNLFIVYELDTWSRYLNTQFTLGDCLFGPVKVTKNAEPSKYGYIGYGIGYDACSQSLLLIGEYGKNVIFGVDNSSSRHNDNREKDVLVLGEGPTDRSDDTTTAESKYSINITKSRKKICLSLRFNVVNSFLYTDSVKIVNVKAKDSETKPYLCPWELFQKTLQSIT